MPELAPWMQRMRVSRAQGTMSPERQQVRQQEVARLRILHGVQQPLPPLQTLLQLICKLHCVLTSATPLDPVDDS